MAKCSIPGNPKGAEQTESIASGWVCQHCCRAKSDQVITREANNSRKEGLEKKKRRLFHVPAVGGKRWGVQALTTSFSVGEDGHLEFYKVRWGWGVQDSRQKAHDYG